MGVSIMIAGEDCMRGQMPRLSWWTSHTGVVGLCLDFLHANANLSDGARGIQDDVVRRPTSVSADERASPDDRDDNSPRPSSFSSALTAHC